MLVQIFFIFTGACRLIMTHDPSWSGGMVQFADAIYNVDTVPIGNMLFKWPTYKPDAPPRRRWRYRNVGNRHIDKKEFEDFKTKFYAIEGWDPATGWPTRQTLESLGMEDVAETLMENGKL
jgi:aldehyde:ferredoxin oxidoreductase